MSVIENCHNSPVSVLQDETSGNSQFPVNQGPVCRPDTYTQYNMHFNDMLSELI